jgi:hypothetical protein
MPLVTGARLAKQSAANRTLVTADNHQKLHGDGLLKFQGSANELPHLSAIVLQLVIILAVGQVKFFHADKFDLKLFDLFESERGESGLWFAAEHLADEDRESAAVGKHGLVHDLNWQSVAKKTARD